MEYTLKKLSFDKFLRYEFEDGSVYDYEITYRDMPFRFLINVKKSDKAVVFGQGAIHRNLYKLPVYNRNSWKDDFNCSTIFFSDPTLNFNENARLCWGYGTLSRWYLEDIAFLILKICNKLNVSMKNVIFTGSSGGGFQSIMLSVMLRAKSVTMNPQFDLRRFIGSDFDTMKSTVLKDNEELIEERCSVLSLIKREKFFPPQRILINSLSDIDIIQQFIPFIQELHKDNINISLGDFDVHVFSDEKGHNGLPDKNKCIEHILKPFQNENKAFDYELSYDMTDYPKDSFLYKYKKGLFDIENPNKLYIIITIDAECGRHSNIPYLYECDFGEKGECGVNYIMDTLEKRGMRGVFFTNIYKHQNFTGAYEGYLEKLIKKINDRGHEVGLHDHSNVDAFYNASYEKMKETLSYGVDFIEKNIGKKPVSYRGGAYRCTDMSLKVLSDSGFAVDSSYYYTDSGTVHGNQNKVYHTLNQVAKIDKLLEFPIINCFNDKGQIRKFDPNFLSCKEMIDIVEQMKQRPDFNAANLILHSFSFIDQKGTPEQEPFFVCGNKKAYGVCQPLINDFEDFLDHLANDPDIEVVTYEEYLKLGLPVPSCWGDGIFHTDTDKSKEVAKSFKCNRINQRNKGTDRSEKEKMNFENCIFPPLKSAFLPEQAVERANDVLNNKLHVYQRVEPLEYDLDSFDFNIRHTKYADTFQLYLHGFSTIGLLTTAFEMTANFEYLKFANRFIQKWFEFASDPNNYQDNNRVFRDHTVALRINNLIHFGRVCSENAFWDKDMYDLIYTILTINTQWLVNEKNYTPAHNHGIMQDEALLHSGFLFQRQDWIDLAKKRLGEQEKAAFTSEFVHVENSPGYATMVKDLFVQIGKFLIENNDPYGQKFLDDMKNTTDYINIVTQPNGFLAQIGDTVGHPDRLYTSEMKRKRNIEDKFKIYPQSGYFYYRSKWEGDSKDDTWKMFKSGYVKTTHKHADELSFIIYSKGYEIFTDCGNYGYTKDAFREYFTSAKAHNTIIVDNASYEIKNNKTSEAGFLKCKTGDKYHHIRGFNNSYKNVAITRDFCSCGDLTVLYDNINSDVKHDYSFLFHLAENIEVLSSSDTMVTLGIADTGYRVVIKTFNASSKLSVINGDIKCADYGIVSRAMNHLNTITTLKFDVNADNYEQITMIAIVDPSCKVKLEDEEINLEDIVLRNKTFKLGRNGLVIGRDKWNDSNEEITIENKVVSVDYAVTSNSLKCILNTAGSNENYEFAYYLMKNNDAVEKQMYTINTYCEFAKPTPGEYYLKYFVRCGNEKKSFLAEKITIS